MEHPAGLVACFSALLSVGNQHRRAKVEGNYFGIASGLKALGRKSGKWSCFHITPTVQYEYYEYGAIAHPYSTFAFSHRWLS